MNIKQYSIKALYISLLISINFCSCDWQKERKLVNQSDKDQTANKNINYIKPEISEIEIPKITINSKTYNQKIKHLEKKYDEVRMIDSSLFVVFEGGHVSTRADEFAYSGGKCGIVNINDEEILPIVFSDIAGNRWYDKKDIKKNMSYSLSTTSKTKYGFFNLEKRFITDAVFDYLDNYLEGITWAKYEGKWGVINQNAEPLLDFKYDNIGMIAQKKYAIIDNTIINVNNGYFLDLNIEGVNNLEIVATDCPNTFIIGIRGEFTFYEVSDSLTYINHSEETISDFKYLENGYYLVSKDGSVPNCYNELKGSPGLFNCNSMTLIAEPNEYEAYEIVNNQIIFCRGCETEMEGAGSWALCRTIGGLWGIMEPDGSIKQIPTKSKEKLIESLDSK